MPRFLICLALAILAQSALQAQSVDAGRGEVPLVVPASYRAESPAPLIILLHGFGGTGAGVRAFFGFDALAHRYGFLLAAPEGLAADDMYGMKQPRFWNATSACCELGGIETDDTAYLTKFIEAVRSNYRVDEKRIYLVGHSNGAFMAHRMARERPDTVAAIVALAGTLGPEPGPSLESPVHVLQIHGTADSMILYGGGKSPGIGDYLGAEQTLRAWAVHNGCDTVQHELGRLDLVAAEEGPETVILRQMPGCRPGGSAELWKMNAIGHMPAFSDAARSFLVEWLLGHPKP